MNKIKLFILFLPAFICLSCSTDNTTDPVVQNKSVRYYAIISPSDDTNVLKTVTYTSATGSDVSENVAIFNRTVSFASGSVVNLSASGTTTSILNIRVRVEIYIDNQLAASQETDGPGSAFATATATVP